VGRTSTDGYTYDSSEAEDAGTFLGLALDEDNQPDQTQDRIANWVAALERELA
jgi:flavodoxin I